MRDDEMDLRTFLSIVVWILCVGYVGIIIGAGAQTTIFPTKYANGYCAALGDERITDETCNVDGKVVVIQ